VLARLVVACVLLAPAVGAAQTTKEIFRIIRSAGPTYVRYEARLTRDGQLDPKNPVAAWRARPDGSTYPIESWDYRFFYGFKVKLDKSGKYWILTIVAAKKRPMKLHLVNGQPQAEGHVGGVWARVSKFYVKFKEGIIPGVSWIDIFGTDVKTGAAVKERVVP